MRLPPPHLAYSVYSPYSARLYLEFVEELISRGTLKRGLTRVESTTNLVLKEEVGGSHLL